MVIILLCGCCDFNPRPPCGGRHIPPTSIDTVPKISIHVLRAEDDVLGSKLPTAKKFKISIHVLRAEDDAWDAIMGIFAT